MPDSVWTSMWARLRIGVSRLFALDEEIENLREQFYVTLRAQLARIESQSPPDSPALVRVRELLLPERCPRWSECYEVEQLLVDLMDDTSLHTELEVRLIEAKANLRRAGLADYYEQEIRMTAEPGRRRALLSRLLNDLQWRYTVLEGKRRFSKSLTTRTSIAFLVALTGFFVLATLVYVKGWSFVSGDLRLLTVAGVAGAWGASFSMLTGLNARIERSAIYDLNVMRAITMVTARVLVGAGAACVLFLFFHSGFLSGSAFPDLQQAVPCTPEPTQCVPLARVALLTIWCFIAGFSEKLVTGLLARAEARITAQDPVPEGSGGPPGRYRPTELAPAPVPSGAAAAASAASASAERSAPAAGAGPQ